MKVVNKLATVEMQLLDNGTYKTDGVFYKSMYVYHKYMRNRPESEIRE